MGEMYKRSENGKTLTPIATYYRGNYFRSRLEARWAYLFDLAGIIYVYEMEGYQLNQNTFYLPDFYLPQFECYAEVKPDLFNIYKINAHRLDVNDAMHYSHVDLWKWLLFSQSNKLLVLIGNPHNMPLMCLENCQWEFKHLNIKDFRLDNVPILKPNLPLGFWVMPANKKQFDHDNN